MATSAADFAAQLVADLESDRPRCTVVRADDDQRFCDQPGASVQVTCRRGHTVGGAHLCLHHVKIRLYCPARIGGATCEAPIADIVAEVA